MSFNFKKINVNSTGDICCDDSDPQGPPCELILDERVNADTVKKLISDCYYVSQKDSILIAELDYSLYKPGADSLWDCGRGVIQLETKRHHEHEIYVCQRIVNSNNKDDYCVSDWFGLYELLEQLEALEKISVNN